MVKMKELIEYETFFKDFVPTVILCLCLPRSLEDWQYFRNHFPRGTFFSPRIFPSSENEAF